MGPPSLIRQAFLTHLSTTHLQLHTQTRTHIIIECIMPSHVNRSLWVRAVPVILISGVDSSRETKLTHGSNVSSLLSQPQM